MKFNPKKQREGSTTRNGLEDYKSQFMTYSLKVVEGTLKKKIENAKIWHESGFHSKFYSFDFSAQKLVISDEKGKKATKEVQLRDIKSCEDKFEDPDRPNNEEKRSRSLQNFLRKSTNECSWMYGLILVTCEREYELYAPTR